MLRQVSYPSYSMSPLTKVSWGAIWAGAFVSLSLMACFSLLTVGLEMATGSANLASNAGSPLWLWLCGIVAYYIGGWVTAHLTRSTSASDNAVHAFASWAVATLGMVLIVGGTLGAAGAPTFTGGGAEIYAFVLLISEAIAAMVGGQMGTRIYRPVSIEELLPGERTREGAFQGRGPHDRSRNYPERGREAMMQSGRNALERGREFLGRGRENLEKGREHLEKGREDVERGREELERNEPEARDPERREDPPQDR